MVISETVRQAILRRTKQLWYFNILWKNLPTQEDLCRPSNQHLPPKVAASEGAGRHILLFLPEGAKTQFTCELVISQELHTIASMGFSGGGYFSVSFPPELCFGLSTLPFLWRQAAWFKEVHSGFRKCNTGSLMPAPLFTWALLGESHTIASLTSSVKWK